MGSLAALLNRHHAFRPATGPLALLLVWFAQNITAAGCLRRRHPDPRCSSSGLDGALPPLFAMGGGARSRWHFFLRHRARSYYSPSQAPIDRMTVNKPAFDPGRCRLLLKQGEAFWRVLNLTRPGAFHRCRTHPQTRLANPPYNRLLSGLP